MIALVEDLDTVFTSRLVIFAMNIPNALTMLRIVLVPFLVLIFICPLRCVTSFVPPSLQSLR